MTPVAMWRSGDGKGGVYFEAYENVSEESVKQCVYVDHGLDVARVSLRLGTILDELEARAEDGVELIEIKVRPAPLDDVLQARLSAVARRQLELGSSFALEMNP